MPTLLQYMQLSWTGIDAAPLDMAAGLATVLCTAVEAGRVITHFATAKLTGLAQVRVARIERIGKCGDQADDDDAEDERDHEVR